MCSNFLVVCLKVCVWLLYQGAIFSLICLLFKGSYIVQVVAVWCLKVFYYIFNIQLERNICCAKNPVEVECVVWISPEKSRFLSTVLVKGLYGLWQEAPPHSLCLPSLTATEKRVHCLDGWGLLLSSWPGSSTACCR